MLYKVIGLMSGSSLDGLDIAYVHLQEVAGKWEFSFRETVCLPYTEEWGDRLKNAVRLNAYEYQLLHTDYGHFIGQQVNAFIADNSIEHQVDLISSHGHTTFHDPARKMTGQLGDGAAIAAETELSVVTDLRALDVAFGGQGAPIVPIGEKLLLGEYGFFLNLGGIANISVNDPVKYAAFDVCPANKILNLLANKAGKQYDDGGSMAATGHVNQSLLSDLNQLEYYGLPYPKSLANDFGTDVVYQMITGYDLKTEDALATMVEHIAIQLRRAFELAIATGSQSTTSKKLLITGGGALNHFLVARIKANLDGLTISIVVPDKQLVEFKEALVMGLIGVLRWREEYNVLASVTGAKRNSIGGALWIGGEA